MFVILGLFFLKNWNLPPKRGTKRYKRLTANYWSMVVSRRVAGSDGAIVAAALAQPSVEREDFESLLDGIEESIKQGDIESAQMELRKTDKIALNPDLE